MGKMQLVEEYEGKVTTQKYGQRQVIEGVERIPLKVFADEGGDFCEIARMNGGGLEEVVGFVPKQVSYSYLHPETVKAFHLHEKQTDVWFVPPRCQMLVGLLDVRHESETSGNVQRFVLGAGKSELLVIPPGVAHGMANLWSEGSCVMYFTDEQFDLQNPDEKRLPWDVLGRDFWEKKKE